MNGDERLDQVLRELGGAAPAEGMERRIARAMAGRVAADERRAVWPPRRVLLGGAGTAALMLLVLMPLLLHHTHTASKEETAPGMQTAHEGTVGAETERLIHAAPAVSSLPLQPHKRRVSGGARSEGREQTSTRTAEVAASYAPTLVAPPEPLTSQERLLLRVVRGGDAEQKSALDARVRDAQFVAEKAEVEAFFRPPEPPKQHQ